MLVFNIEKHIAEIGSTAHAVKQLNLVSWNKAPARLDLRGWREDDDGEMKPNKGITLTDAEARNLYNALGEYLQHGTA